MRPTRALVVTILLGAIGAFAVAVILTGIALAAHRWLHS